MSRIDFYLKPEIANGTGPEAAQVSEFITNIAQAFSRIIRDEDYVMSSSQQTAANSGALATVVFGRNEPALHHYHSTYRIKLGLEPMPLLASVGSGDL